MIEIRKKNYELQRIDLQGIDFFKVLFANASKRLVA